ncbi:MAG: protein kinase [Acidobacteria bacterium]|nr:protein kinase [Acidobacteriota bacterium]
MLLWMIGTTLSHYKILETLGEGGMGVVYKARDLKLDRFVAIKVLPVDKTADATRKQRFLQEARAASALNHPNIVVVHEIAEENGVDFIVMEYVPGRTLDQVIPRKGLRVAETLRYATQIAAALTAAHEAGITHRDLKPGNLMVTDKGVVKILDFGLAKLEEKTPLKADDATATDTERPQTEKGTILATVAYMSPEQAEGKPVDPRSDIFSFGSVMHEMCTGTRAFGGETKMSTLSMILREDPKPVRASNEEVPPELERIISRCLRKSPARRFQSTADLQIALEELREESDSGRLSGLAAGAKPRARSWWRWATVAAGVVLMGAVGWWLVAKKPAAQSQQGPVLTQLTFDTGLTTEPSNWAQGNLIAYASDRATEGANLDIWIQQLNGGEARRLTTNPADDRTPDIAPDGSKIVFRSEREGGGLYVVPMIGGAERKIAPSGYDPKFSPDGQWIAYWTGDAATYSNVFGPINGDARLMLVPANGGSPKQAFAAKGAFRPAWSADSRHLLFGWMSLDGQPDWYVIPVEGGEAKRTGFWAMAKKSKLEIVGQPMRWTSNGIYFNARLGDGTNTWKAEIDPRTFQCSGELSRVTSSSGAESNITVSGGTIVYANSLNNDDVYILPMDTDHAKVMGEPIRLTRNTAPEYGATISHDGKRVGYAALMSGEFGLFIRDLGTGADTRVASIPGTGTTSVSISPDGKRLVWSVSPNRIGELHIGSIDGASVKLAAEGQARSWGGDPARVVLTRPEKEGVGVYLLDVDSGKETKVMARPSTSGVHLSMDGRSIVYYASNASVSKVYLMPVFLDRLTTEKDLITVTDGAHFDVLPEISPNGNIVYFYSNRDGSQCLWAQRLKPESKQPDGAPFAVKHFHSARISPAYVSAGRRRIDTARDKIVFTMAERTGNIWRADIPQ